MTSFKIVLEQEYGQGPNHYFLNANSVPPVYDKSGGSEIVFEHTGEKSVFYLKSGGNYLGVSSIAEGSYPHTKEAFSPLAFTVLPSNSKDRKLFKFLLEDISPEFGVVLRNLGTNQLLSYIGEKKYMAALVHYNVAIMRLIHANNHSPVESMSHFQSLVQESVPAPHTSESGAGGTDIIPLHSKDPFKLTKTAIIAISITVILFILLIVFLILRFK